ncbi:MAG: hypothetical protein AAGA57_02845 [Planctomycetota bacterium]
MIEPATRWLFSMAPALGQGASWGDDRTTQRVIVGLLGFAGISLAGVAAAVVIRKLQKKLGAEEEVGGAPAFTLGELRRLHREGQLTDQEFARAREAMVASMAPGLAAPGGDSGPGTPGTALEGGEAGETELGPELLGPEAAGGPEGQGPGAGGDASERDSLADKNGPGGGEAGRAAQG